MARLLLLAFNISTIFLITFAISPFNLKRTRKIYPTSDNETDYRLPNNTKPQAYSLFISTDIADGIFDYYGIVKINITILKESNEITLHQYELNIQAVNLTSEQGEMIRVQSPYYDQSRDFVIIKTINYTFSPEDTIFLEVKFNGNLREDNYGFYRSSYSESNAVISEGSSDNSKELLTKR